MIPLRSSDRLLSFYFHPLLLHLICSHVCRWRSFLFCCPKIKKAKRRLTVDPFDFDLRCDSTEPGGGPTQVELGSKVD